MHALRRVLVLAAVTIVVNSARATAQGPGTPLPRDSAKVAIIRQLLKQMHAVDVAVSAMELQIPAQRAANPQIPTVFWDRFMTLVHGRANDLENVYVVIYDRHFTTDELRQLIAFYQTPVGRKLLDKQPMILKESMMAGQQWGQKIGSDVAQQLSAEGVRFQP